MADDPRLEELLLRWEDLHDQGRAPSVDDLCRDCPGLADALRDRIRALLAVNAQLGSTLDVAPSTAVAVRQLGRYRLEALLGQGTFGQVWRGHDPELQRPVAVKVPRPDRLATAAQREAFLTEARKVAQLEHPGILPVYDVGRDGEACFIVTRLAEGGDLAGRLQRERLSPADAARLVAGVADALHFAHLRGFVHRDVKPANVLLDARGVPWLGDFGLAVTEAELARERGGVLGTLAYMAPEQAEGRSHQVDGRADVYSLGVVFYELLTGRRPFQAETTAALLDQVRYREPRPPRSVDDRLPRELERVCLRCLAKRPSDRYPTAGDLAEELRQWLFRGDPGAPAAPAATAVGLDFSAERDRWRRDFTGRAWLDAELTRWQNQPAGRVFLLTGDPGTGKSAYLAHVADTSGTAAAVHFCLASLAETIDPVRFVQSLAAQLAERLPGFQPGTTAAAEADVLFRRLLADPLRALPPRPPVLILVDGLDEAATFGERHLGHLLRDRLADLPPWVRLVLSTRKEPALLDLFSPFQPFEIDVTRADHRADLAAFLRRRLTQPDLAARVQGAGADPDALARGLAERAAGNFLYATQALDALAGGQLDPRRPEAFPEGLVGVYQAAFARAFPQRQDFERLRPVLEILAVAREPVTAEQLAAYTDRDALDVAADLERVAAFFPERGGQYRPFHKSITDWLLGAAGRSKTYRVSAAAGHARLGARLLAAFRAGRPDGFGQAHVVHHLQAAGRWDDLAGLLTDLTFVAAQAKAGRTAALVRDYQTALAAWPGHDRHEDLFGPPPAPPPAWLRECTAAVLAGAEDPHPDRGAGPTLRALRALPDADRLPQDPTPRFAPGTALPPELFGPDDQDVAGALRAMRQTAAAERAGRDPHARATAAGAVQAFAAFVTAHAHLLSRESAGIVPLAVNHAATGPLAEQAERLAGRLTEPWLRRAPRPPVAYTRPACYRTLQLPAGPERLALSADGRVAVTGDETGRIHVWDLERGEAVRTLAGRGQELAQLALTPDGRFVAAVDVDATLQVWDLHEVRRPPAALTPVDHRKSVALSADGALVAAIDPANNLRVGDTARGVWVQTVRLPSRTLQTLALTPDGRLALTGSPDGAIDVWDLAWGAWLRTLKGHTLPVQALAVSADGRVAVSAGRDRALRGWDVVGGTCLRLLEAPGDAARHESFWVSKRVALTPDGRLAVSVGFDATLRAWDVSDGTCPRVFATTAVADARVAASGRVAATVGAERQLCVWDLAHGSAPRTEGHRDVVYTLRWTADGARAISASRDQTVRVWDTRTLECRRVLTGHEAMVHGVAWLPDGIRAVSTGWDPAARVWDTVSGDCLAILKGHEGAIRDVAVTADGQRALTAAYDATVRIWSLADGACLQTLNHDERLLCVAVSPDGRLAWAGDWRGRVWHWDLDAGRPIRQLHGHTGWLTTVALSPDGRRLLSAGKDAMVKVWDVATGQLLQTLPGHGEEVLQVVWAPDGRTAASCGEDRTVRVWEVATGRCLAVYHAGAAVRSVAAWAGGRFACGTVHGELHQLELCNG